MIVKSTSISEVIRIIPEVIREKHEWRTETYSWHKFHANGIKVLFTVDMETTVPYKNTIRGLYYQNEPRAQNLLVRCTRGAILQAAVDIRPSSETYGKWVLVELSSTNNYQLFIPKGFAQGFLTLSDDVIVQYKADSFCSSEFERRLNYADPQIGIKWPNNGKFIVSVLDKKAPGLKNIYCNYI
jgi:dTDP-4-dehydrorhamnose 3,5-epimerase